ncbi:MAG: hypothetical protein ACRDLV_10080 [Solirubrobacteraceae bacterium]
MADHGVWKMSYSDAISQVAQIGADLSGLQSAFSPQAVAPAGSSAESSSGAASSVQGTGSFSSALAGALSGSDPTTSAAMLEQTLSSAQSELADTGTSGDSSLSTMPGVTSFPSLPDPATILGLGDLGLSSSELGVASGAPGLDGSSGSSLPPAATAQMTSGQQAFASRLAADTGLDPGVVSAWLLAEENGGAAVSRQSAGNNDWLNIGYTDGGTYGAADSVWSDPVAAADATAGWLRGQDTIPGYGTASGGIQAILQTAGQGPAAQIAAIQGSGWASGGYPELGTLYQQVAG